MIFAFAFIIAGFFANYGSTESITNSNDEEFLSWITKNGGKIKISLKNFSDMGRGVVAVSDITLGDQVIVIPKQLIITSKGLKESSFPSHLKADEKAFLSKTFETEEEIIAAFLLYEMSLSSESFWYPYFKVLPDYIPNLSYFSNDEIHELEQSEFEKSIINANEKMIGYYYNFINKCSLIWPFCTEFTLDQYRHVRAIIDSRGLRFQGKVHLAPLADMFNYKPHSVARPSQAGDFFLQHHQLQQDGALVITADRDCDAGDQLYEDYGDNPDNIYLQYHGFVPENNPFRCISLTAPMLSTLPSHQQKLLRALHFKIPPKACVDSSGSLGEGLEVYLAATAYTEEEAEECITFTERARKAKQVWSSIARACHFTSVRTELEKIRLESKKAETSDDDTPPLADDRLEIRTVRRVRDWIVDSFPKFRTSVEDDKLALHNLQEEIKSNERMENPVHADAEFKQEAVVDVLGDAGGSTLNSTASEDSEETSSKRALQKKVLYTAHRLAMKGLWVNLCAKYNVSHRCGAIKDVDNDVAGDASLASDSHRPPAVIEDSNEGNGSSLLQKLELFRYWFHGTCPDCTQLEVVKMPGFRLGTIATADIRKEDEYLRVPLELIMDADKAYNDPAMKALLHTLHKRFNRRDDFHELLFYLIHEKYVRGPKSKFWSYIQLLPEKSDLDVPIYWSAPQRVLRLAPSLLLEDSNAYADRVSRFYLSTSKVEVIMSFFPENVLTEDSYRWAHVILDSRSIWWHGKRHLVPLLDMVNCAQGPFNSRVHSTGLDASEKFAVTKAAGDQVFEDYGQPNHIYFAYHGFSIPDSRHNCVQIRFSLTTAEAAAFDNSTELAKKVLSHIGVKSAAELLLGATDLVTKFCLSNVSAIPDPLWLLIAVKLNVVQQLLDGGRLGLGFPEGYKTLRSHLWTRLRVYVRHRETTLSIGNVHNNSLVFLGTEEQLLASLVRELDVLLI